MNIRSICGGGGGAVCVVFPGCCISFCYSTRHVANMLAYTWKIKEERLRNFPR